DYHAAFDAYRTAWSLKQTFDIACNLGRTEVELSLARDAAEHLDYCLRTFSVSSRGEVRDAKQRFRDLFVRVRREVAALSVEAHPAGTEISVDGASYGLAPLGHELFLVPGEHRVRAHLTGFEAQERIVNAEAGGAVSLSLTLEHAPAPAVAAAPVAPPPRDEAPPSHGVEPRTLALVAGSSLSLVALGIGVGFALDANAAREDAKSLGKKIHASPAGGCIAPELPECQELRTLVNRQGDSRHAADIALVTAAAVEGATLLAWLVIPSLAPTKKAGGLRAVPLLGRSSSGILLTGAY
ncbi:MAG TPA: PEGA domain-containing protein, partial [Polyangiaceae bacterium]|nr:PEGA domain-containing protein [Polyangiaceae bacterium]